MVSKSPWAGYTDDFGRTVDAAALGAEFAFPQSIGRRRVIGETIASGLTPEGLAAILQRAASGDIRAYLTLAEEMEERYLHYASQLQTRRLAVEGITPTVEHDDKVPAKIVDAVNALVEPSAFDEMAGTLTDAIAKGFSVAEMMWEYQDRMLKPVEYKWRDPRFFQFDEATQTELRLADDSAPRDGLVLPGAKFVIHTPRSKMGLPIRRGMARPAAWAFLIQTFSLQDWASFSEIYGVPLRVGTYGPNASQEDRRALLTAVRMIANDAAAIVPAGMTLEFHKIEGQHGAAVFGGLIDYVDKQVSKLILGQTMTSDNGSSMAQAKVHNEVRLDIMSADARQLAQTINRDLIVPFVIMNFGPQAVYPRVAYPVAEPEDIKELTEAIQRLVPLGLRVSQREMRERIGLGEPEKGEELLVAPKPQPALPSAQTAEPPVKGGGKDPDEAASGAATSLASLNSAGLPSAGADAIDLSIDAMLAGDGWERLIQPMVTGLDAQLASASSEAEAVGILAAHFRSMDTEALTDMLARATFAARLAGEADEPLSDGA